jgi:hypothetical protein
MPGANARHFFGGDSMIVVTERDPYYGHIKHHECSHCRNPLTVPYMAWTGLGDETLFICGKCCEWIKHGFCIDLHRIATMMEAIRMGFDVPNVGAVSGGFLYTTGTSNKQ